MTDCSSTTLTDHCTIYATPNYFCERHRDMGKEFIRCAHKDNRFVVQIQDYVVGLPGAGCVDYIEDNPTEDCTVQPIGYFDNPEDAENLWQKGLALLTSDTPVRED